MAVFIIVRILNAFHPINGLDPDEGIRKVVVFRLDAVMHGVIFAWLNYYKKDFINGIKNQLFAISAIGIVVLYYFTNKYDLIFFAHFAPVPAFFRNAFLLLFIPLLYVIAVPAVCQ